jgi:hypothetical protein
MQVHIVAQKTLVVGKGMVMKGPSPLENGIVAVFEDDGETGYFYAMDKSWGIQPIVDALHIYNVESVQNAQLPCTVQILWSADGQKAALVIDEFPHAVFDFAARRGYCRSGFPPPDPNIRWTTHPHDWDDAALELFE